MSDSDLLHRRILRVRRGMFLAACVGFVVAAYLAVTYVGSAPIACGPLHGCDIVRASRFAKWFGVPTPLFGLAFYAAVMVLLVIRTAMPHWRRLLCYRLTCIIAVFGFIESVFLFFVQLIDLQAFCTWCLGSAVAATVIFALSWFDGHAEFNAVTETKELRFQFASLGVTLVIGVVIIAALTIPKSNGTPPVIQPANPETESEAWQTLYHNGLSFEGPADAPVTIVEFTDFECPACRHAHPEVKKVLAKYAGKVRFIYRQFPLPVHPNAKGAAVAAVCADHQGKLYPYADFLFSGEAKLSRDDLIHAAADLRLDLDVFVPCLAATSTREAVARDVLDGDALGVRETPTFFVNGLMIDGLPNADQLGAIIEQMLGGS